MTTERSCRLLKTKVGNHDAFFLRARWNPTKKQPQIRALPSQIEFEYVAPCVLQYFESVHLPEVEAESELDTRWPRNEFLFGVTNRGLSAYNYPPWRWAVDKVYPIERQVGVLAQVHSEEISGERRDGQRIGKPTVTSWTWNGKPCLLDDYEECPVIPAEKKLECHVATISSSPFLIVWRSPLHIGTKTGIQAGGFSLVVGFPPPLPRTVSRVYCRRWTAKPEAQVGKMAQKERKGKEEHEQQVMLNLVSREPETFAFRETALKVFREFQQIQLPRRWLQRSRQGLTDLKHRVTVALLLKDNVVEQVWGDPKNLTLTPLSIAKATARSGGLYSGQAWLTELGITVMVRLFPFMHFVRVWETFCRLQGKVESYSRLGLNCRGAFAEGVFCIWDIRMEHGIVDVEQRHKWYQQLPCLQPIRHTLRYLSAMLMETKSGGVEVEWESQWERKRVLAVKDLSFFPGAKCVEPQAKLQRVVSRMKEEKSPLPIGLLALPFSPGMLAEREVKPGNVHGLMVFAVIEELHWVVIQGENMRKAEVVYPKELERRKIKYTLGSRSALLRLEKGLEKNEGKGDSAVLLRVAQYRSKVLVFQFHKSGQVKQLIEEVQVLENGRAVVVKRVKKRGKKKAPRLKTQQVAPEKGTTEPQTGTTRESSIERQCERERGREEREPQKLPDQERKKGQALRMTNWRKPN